MVSTVNILGVVFTLLRCFQAEIWNVDVILRDKEDSNRSLVVDDIDLGLLYINEHSAVNIGNSSSIIVCIFLADKRGGIFARRYGLGHSVGGRLGQVFPSIL